MLETKDVTATVAVRDIGAARKFYEEILGFAPGHTDNLNFVSYQSGRFPFLVYKSEFAGGYKATIATWWVGEDIESIVDTLVDKGIIFEHYTLMPNTTIEGNIHISGEMRSAWFKDPDGNIFCLVNVVSPQA